MKWPFLAAFKPAPEKPRIEPRLSFRRESHSGSGPCRLVQALPAERRAVVTARCPRCGTSSASAEGSRGVAACALQGLDLDASGVEQDEQGRLMPSLSFRAT